MKHYEGTDFNECDDEVDALIAAMLANGEPTYTELNGVKLVAEPEVHATRPGYADELKWSFWMTLRRQPIVTSVLGEEGECLNLVPKLETLCGQLMNEFDNMNHADARTMLNWFIRLMPITWCKDVMSEEQVSHILTTLGEREEYRGWRHANHTPPFDHEWQGYWHVMLALGVLKSFNLNEAWLEDVKKWLAVGA